MLQQIRKQAKHLTKTIIMVNRTIVWVTPEFFVETDIYIVPALAEYYNIKWTIIHTCHEQVIPFYKVLLREGNNPNIDVRFRKLPSGSPLSKRYFKFYWNIITEIKSDEPDLIYSAILDFPFIPLAIIRVLKKKIIFAAHNVNTPKGVKHYKLTKAYMGLCLSWFKNFQTFSKSQYDLLNKKYKRKNAFFAPFVLKDYGTPTIIANEIITFLFFGRIRQYKCPDALINAAQKLKKRTNIPFKVIIAGECSNWYEYQQLIKYPELFDLIIHSIDNENIPNLFARCHYTILPYQDIAQSGALFVGINYSKPAILSDLPAFKEVLTDNVNSLFIKPANVDDLVEKMKYILENHRTLYPVLISNLIDMKEKTFKKDLIVDKYRQYIDSLF